jgi:hypothetical protein
MVILIKYHLIEKIKVREELGLDMFKTHVLKCWVMDKW